MKLVVPRIRTILPFLVLCLVLSELYAVLEFMGRRTSDEPVALVPLLIRATTVGLVIGLIAALFESNSVRLFRQRSFLYIVGMRGAFYAVVTTVVLSIVNTAWNMIDRGLGVLDALRRYFVNDQSYLVNLLAVFTGIAILVAVYQISTLHRKGDLINFILGRYQQPRELRRIFCFIDLNDSTMIGERLGHVRFGSFLKDYFADITEAIRATHAEIYQYVGDEIILSWPFEAGARDGNAIRCFFEMRKAIQARAEYYRARYDHVPTFKGGIHGGTVVVTWVGEIKREIVYAGDVLNTTARIREATRRLQADLLISETVLQRIEPSPNYTTRFAEETIPRGREQSLRLYAVSEVDGI